MVLIAAIALLFGSPGPATLALAATGAAFGVAALRSQFPYL